ncbi:MAG: hypothetical protein IKF56_00560 [Eggerthellaceae bacterium]|nr:hypothetical protein [Eggerthellaceae bacterium]
MGTVLIDNEWLAAELPEGLERMPHDELESFMRFKYDLMWGVCDSARHMLVCVTWRDSNKLITKLVSEKFFVKQVNEAFFKRYRDRDYHPSGFFTHSVAGASGEAQGLRFSYVADGVAWEGEVLVFKRGIRCYTLCFYTQSGSAAESRAAYEAILASLEVRQ